ncbi:MAG TPA: hypothetical protein VF060_24700, partial [Trebonia sp.]
INHDEHRLRHDGHPMSCLSVIAAAGRQTTGTEQIGMVGAFVSECPSSQRYFALSNIRLCSRGRRILRRCEEPHDSLAATRSVTNWILSSRRSAHAWRSGGVAEADRVSVAEAPAVMLSEDFKNGVESLKQHGLGHATFHGR